jgi:starvation-inducible DNA-binding protein
MKPNIGISENHLKNSIDLLAKSLADEVTLYTKIRKFHWNVACENFMEMHKLFQAQYTELEETIDEIAERINKLGGKTMGTMSEFLEITSIKEAPNVYPNHKEMLVELLDDHETIIKEFRKYIDASNENKDAGTADFFTGLLQQHETLAWILRRYLS